MDRNVPFDVIRPAIDVSLSARRAWIEITLPSITGYFLYVALRKESVDRNQQLIDTSKDTIKSLSARRAWIEIGHLTVGNPHTPSRSPQGERG